MAAADPYRLFVQAEAFHEASRKLLPAPHDHEASYPERLAPYIANSVFTLELYLKCLLMIVKGKYPQLHSVQALFFDLPDDEIERVRKLHRHIYRAHFPAGSAASDRARGGRTRKPNVQVEADARLDEILAGAKDAFTSARYAYERHEGSDQGIPDVTVVTGAVRGRILALEPSWGS